MMLQACLEHGAETAANCSRLGRIPMRQKYLEAVGVLMAGGDQGPSGL